MFSFEIDLLILVALCLWYGRRVGFREGRRKLREESRESLS